MGGSDETVAGRTLLQAGQLAEDAATTVVQQKDTEIAAQVLVPQGVLVVEEAEVTDDAKDFPGCHDRKASCRRQRTLDAIDATVAPDVMVGVSVGKTYGGAVGVVNGSPGKVRFEILDGSCL